MNKLLFLILAMFLLALPTVFSTNANINWSSFMDSTSGTTLVADVGADGVVTDAAIWNTGGKIGGAIYPNNLYYGTVTLPTTLEDWAISCWVKPDAFNTQFIFGTTGDLYGRCTSTTACAFSDGTASKVFTVPTLQTGVWYWMMFAINTSGDDDNVHFYLNDTEPDTKETINGASAVLPTTLQIGAANGVGSFLGYIDICKIWNGIPNATQREEEYNNYVGKQAPLSAFTITAKDFFNESNITSFTAILKNLTDTYTNSTTTGNISFENITQGIYNVTIQSTEAGGYIDRFYEDVNANINFEAKLWQAIVYINASSNGEKIEDFWASTGTQTNNSNSTGWATLRLNAKSHNITGNATYYTQIMQNLSLSALEEKYFEFNFYRNMLSINASDIFSNQTINSFTVNVIGLNVTYDRTLSTSSGQINFSLPIGNYSMVISGSTIAKAYANVTVNVLIKNYTFKVFTINSVYIQIFKEGTSTLLTPNSVKASFDSALSVFNLSTINGTIYSENMVAGAYTITMSSLGYTTRDYFITLTSGENVQLNAYLENTTNYEDITFTMKDVITLTTLENIVVSVSERINLTYVTIAQKISDIAGQVVFTLDQAKTYRFTLNADGYTTKVFDLQPVLTAYTITLDKSITLDWSTFFSKITYLLLPNRTVINAGENVNFSIITSSLGGTVQNYFGLNTTYLGIQYKTNISGSPAGGTASITLNLNNASFSTISIGYFISVSGENIVYINRDFYLSNITAINATIIGFEENLKQNINSGYLSIIAVLGTILIMGTFWSLGIKGNQLSVIGAMSMGIFTYFGFIHPNPVMNGIIGSIITITLLGSYFILTRIGD